MSKSRDRGYVEVKTPQAAEIKAFIESHLGRLETGTGIAISSNGGVFRAEFYPTDEPAI